MNFYKKLILFILTFKSFFLFAGSVVFGQMDSTKYIAYYKLTHFPENLPYRFDERMILLIGDQFAQFKSYDRFKRDSILQYQLNQGGGGLAINFKDPEIPRYSSTQQTFKNLNTGKGYVSDWLLQTYYWDYSWPTLEWTIHQDTLTIGGYLCQKATTVSPATGWEWTVWFTPDIPVSNGPQLLDGLPGLVVQASDNQGRTSYELTGFGLPSASSSFLVISLPDGAVKSTRENFERAQALSKQDPDGYINNSGIFQGKVSGHTIRSANDTKQKNQQR
jgi:GLPGLI family protein